MQVSLAASHYASPMVGQALSMLGYELDVIRAKNRTRAGTLG
jgi:hypothetical protein